MTEPVILSTEQYRSIAQFRHQLRRFLAFSEAAAAAVGLPAQQHQALLAIAGHAGAEPPSVGTLAEQLIVAPHTAAELVARMVDAGLVSKTAAASDRRRQELALTAKAAALLASLTAAHRDELTKLHDLAAQAVLPPAAARVRSRPPAPARGDDAGAGTAAPVARGAPSSDPPDR